VGAERGHLDDLAPEHHVRQPEAAPDQTAIAEQRLHLLRGGVGGDVEVLGLEPHQQVADRATHQVGFVPALAQPVQHPQGRGADVLAGNGMAVARDPAQLRYDGVVLYWHQASWSVGGGSWAGRGSDPLANPSTLLY